MKLTAASRRGTLSPALPVPYPALANAGLRLRRGQLSLFVAAPGVGKSQLLLNITQRTPVPGLYWSADTDAHDVLCRVTALHAGVPAGDVDEMRRTGWQDHFVEKISAGKHVDWVFDSPITAQGLADRLNAYAEVRGGYPHIAVVDNLSNTVIQQGDTLAEQSEFINKAQGLAREAKTHIAILAHAKGEYERTGSTPIPIGGVLNNLGKLPETVVTLHRADEEGRLLGVNIVKNRSGGQGDPAATHTIFLDVDYSYATVLGYSLPDAVAA